MSADWSGVKSAIGTIAPWIAGTLGTPVAGVAVGALCNALGLSDGSGGSTQASPETVIAAIKGAAPDQLLALKQADQKHQEVMTKLGYDNLGKLAEADTASIQAAEQDRASARIMAIKTTLLPQVVIGMVVLTCWGLIQWFLLEHVIPADMREIIIRLLGTLDAAVILVLQFFFGSNATAHRAQDLLAQSTPPQSAPSK
jgi:uncharacterized protein Smg (DUF494 family)